MSKPSQYELYLDACRDFGSFPVVGKMLDGRLIRDVDREGARYGRSVMCSDGKFKSPIAASITP